MTLENTASQQVAPSEVLVQQQNSPETTPHVAASSAFPATPDQQQASAAPATRAGRTPGVSKVVDTAQTPGGGCCSRAGRAGPNGPAADCRRAGRDRAHRCAVGQW